MSSPIWRALFPALMVITALVALATVGLVALRGTTSDAEVQLASNLLIVSAIATFAARGAAVRATPSQTASRVGFDSEVILSERALAWEAANAPQVEAAPEIDPPTSFSQRVEARRTPGVLAADDALEQAIAQADARATPDDAGPQLPVIAAELEAPEPHRVRPVAPSSVRHYDLVLGQPDARRRVEAVEYDESPRPAAPAPVREVTATTAT